MKDVSEFQLINMLAEKISADNFACIESLSERGFRVRLSIGDDAAAMDGPSGIRVLTTDTMVERVHFNLDWINWRDLGWKSFAVNLSDIAAMGCVPLWSLVTLGLHEDLPVDGLMEMYDGMMDACREYGGAILGGDIVRSSGFFISVVMEGTAVVTDELLTRSSALPGDKIAVTGHLGCSGGGLRMFANRADGLNDKTSEHLKESHNHPKPRVTEGLELAQEGVLAAIDLSDGLVDDLKKVCESSEVGAVVFVDSVPADIFLKTAYPEDWRGLVLSGGEDYELLFTAKPEVMDRVIARLDLQISIIGEIVELPLGVTLLDQHRRPIRTKNVGWDHFGSG